ncbi:hypothetical protein [Geodermatophilus siccatus]|nr:hypothetical protein [Geodermatophilus siccatus]
MTSLPRRSVFADLCLDCRRILCLAEVDREGQEVMGPGPGRARRIEPTP